MKYARKNRIRWQRGMYTFCFFALCLIDWVKGSLNGRAQMTATNLTGIVIALIIFSSATFKKSFKCRFIVLFGLGLIALSLCYYILSKYIPYKGQAITASMNIIIYGYILIRMIIESFKKRKDDQFRHSLLYIWICMMALMLFSINENVWPAWFAVVFGSFYFSEFSRETEIYIYKAIIDGIILGFFFIQGLALAFRPYDVARYSGLYINPNINALFYLMAYSAFLCKWFLVKKEGKNIFLRMINCLFAGSMYGFSLFTGSKTAIIAMLMVTVPFVLLSIKPSKKKFLSFAGYFLILGVIGLLSVPIVYGAIRYMPTVHLHPLYFEGEYGLGKIQPGEPRDSEKYVSFEYALETNMGRFFFVFPELENYLDSVFVLHVHATELQDCSSTDYIFSDEEADAGVDPIRVRYEIYRYYFERLNLLGHKNDYEGAPVNYGYTAPHAHNVFIQMAFLYGIPAGILFLLLVISFIPGCVRLSESGEEYRACVVSCYVVAFIAFGFFEIDWMCGQISFSLFFILFRDVVRKRYMRIA